MQVIAWEGKTCKVTCYASVFVGSTHRHSDKFLVDVCNKSNGFFNAESIQNCSNFIKIYTPYPLTLCVFFTLI